MKVYMCVAFLTALIFNLFEQTNGMPCLLCGYQGGYRFNDYGGGPYGYGGDGGGMRYKTLQILGIPITSYQYGRYDYGDGPYGGGGFRTGGRGFYIGKK